MLKQSLFLLVSVSFCLAPALALDYPPPYDAVYEIDNAGQKFTNKIASDGKGKVKSTNEMKTGLMDTVVDYPGKSVTTVMHAQHMWMKQPLSDGYKDESTYKKEAKPLGAATFNGHPCHGYESSNPATGGSTQIWWGDDIHVMVHSVAGAGKVKLVSDLKSYSGKPGDVALTIPDDCKEFKMPTR